VKIQCTRPTLWGVFLALALSAGAGPVNADHSNVFIYTPGHEKCEKFLFLENKGGFRARQVNTAYIFGVMTGANMAARSSGAENVVTAAGDIIADRVRNFCAQNGNAFVFDAIKTVIGQN
jgi:hypothetical protein